MATPKTGQLGGFGESILGAAPEPGDLLHSLPGLIRHYQFDDGSGSTAAVDRCGNGNLPIWKVSDDTSTSLTFQADGVQDKAATLAAGSILSGRVADRYAADLSADFSTALENKGTLRFSCKFTSSSPGSASGEKDIVEQVCGFESPTITSYSATIEGVPTTIYGKEYGLVFYRLNGKLYVSTGINQYYEILSSVTAGQWYDIRVSWKKNPSGYTKVWVDGSLVHDSAYYSHVFEHGDCHFFVGRTPASDTSTYISGWSTSSTPNDATWYYGSFLGSIDNAAIYSDDQADSGFSPVYAGGTTALYLSHMGYSPQPFRVTQVEAEVVRSADSNARITQLLAEAVRSAESHARVTQAFVEVLVNGTPVYSAAGATAMTLAGVASGYVAQSHTVAGTTALTVSPSSTARIPQIFNAAATTAISVPGSGSAVRHEPTPYDVSAASAFNLAGSATKAITLVVPVSATTGVRLGSVAISPTARAVEAATTVYVGGPGNAYNTKIFISAETALSVRGRAAKPTAFGPKPVSASTTLAVSAPASTSAAILIGVSASDSVALSGVGSALKRGPLLVSASTSMRVSQANGRTSPGPRSLALATGITISGVASNALAAVLNVSASSRLRALSTARETASLGASASTAFVTAASSTRSRAITVSAMTSLGLGNAPRTGNLKSVAASSGATVTGIAGLSVTGTEAASSFVFLDLAQAVTWIPWRPTGLTLPPGGNLPHS